MKRAMVSLLVTLSTAGLLSIAGCAQSAPPAPTSAPAEPGKVAPTTAPAKAAAPTTAPAPSKAPEVTKPGATSAPANTTTFPEKGRTITFIVPFAAGGSTDIAVRILAPLLERELGAPVQVVNKAGASTQVGLTELVKSKPDGYTLSTVSFMTVIVTYVDRSRNAVYTRKDFQTIAHFVGDDNVILVNSDSKYKTLKDLVDAARASPDKISIGCSSVLSNTHMLVLQLAKATGAKFNFVQFDGTGPGMTALLGDHIDAFSGSVGGVLSQYKAGQVRALVTAGGERNQFLDGVPTMIESGYDVRNDYSIGIAAPAGTPKEVADVLTQAMRRAMEKPEFKSRLADAGMVPRYMDPQHFDAYWVDFENRITPLIQEVLAEQAGK